VRKHDTLRNAGAAAGEDDGGKSIGRHAAPVSPDEQPRGYQTGRGSRSQLVPLTLGSENIF
jgi:hypothetical protein